jgi:D-glycero-D-manno-heptose 1,7-bisphosphate phosphatase
MSTKALFLDRDGVINVDFGHVYKKSGFQFYPEIFEVVKKAEKAGFLIFVVTNQAGIGRGFYSEEEFSRLTSWMLTIFKEKGCNISEVYYSPFHPTEGLGAYKRDDQSRKPNPGMILQAVESWGLCPPECIMVGDNESDMEAAFRAGLGGRILINRKDTFVSKTVATSVVRGLDQVVTYFA